MSVLRKLISEFPIDDTKRAILCFDERLSIVLKNEFVTNARLIGNYSVFIESVGPQCQEFLVHLKSSLSVNGYISGSRIISSVTQDYLCLEEKRTEFKYREDGLHQKNFFMGHANDVYYLRVDHNCPCEKFNETKVLPIHKNDNNLLGEGTNVLLMRYLAIINYEGSFCLSSVTIDGDLTTCNFKCKAAEDMKLNDNYLRIYEIECGVSNAKGFVQSFKTYLTPNGKILTHDSHSMPYMLQISSLTNLETDDNACMLCNCIQHRLLNDIEIRSKYLDRKNCQEIQLREYLIDHPVVKQLIMDYLQALLIGNENTKILNNLSNIILAHYDIRHLHML